MNPKDDPNYQEPDAVLGKERDFINLRRPENKKVNDDLVGLALSGGGIRSATFGLGVLEGLKRLGLLAQIDYLSTVSGGGYIGSWLSGNCKRAADKGRNWLAAGERWDDSIGRLRSSNYVSPDSGFFSADTWSKLTIWLRNTLLIQFTVVLAIAVALLVARVLFFVFDWWPNVGIWRWTPICLFIVGIVGVAGNLEQGFSSLPFRKWWQGLIAAVCCGGAAWGFARFFNFDPFKGGRADYWPTVYIALLLTFACFWLQPLMVLLANRFRMEQRKTVNYTQFDVQCGIVLPMLAVSVLVGAILWEQAKTDLAPFDSFGALFSDTWRYWTFPLTVGFASLQLLSLCSLHKWSIWLSMAPAVVIVTLYALMCAVVLLLQGWAQKGVEGEFLAFVGAPALALCAFWLAIMMLVGMLGDSSESVREWWGRLGAWLLIYGVAWVIICAMSFYGPLLSMSFFGNHPGRGVSVSLGGVLNAVASLFTTGKAGGKKKGFGILKTAAAVPSRIFVGFLLVAATSAITILHIAITTGSGMEWSALPKDYWCQLRSASHPVVLLVLIGTAGALLVMADRIDINRFSLITFYRSRLVRCYLGATRPPRERHPQNFIGFDYADDLKLTDLVTTADPAALSNLGPFHIVNCSLGLGDCGDLSLRTRRSAIFTLTPFCCGSNYQGLNMLGEHKPEMGYIATADYGDAGGPTLGQAISVSGAAANPNIGYHGSRLVAFLLALFNLRLVWWFPNPEKSGVNSSSPWFSLRYLIMELFGLAGDSSKYLAISDGGHFENLAAYELIRRKCKVIIISDAECDPELQFDGLGSLIRLAKVDMNAIIDIDVSSIRRSTGAKWSASRSAIGTIRYCDDTTGTLIYLKASMTGHEGTGIRQYKSAHSTFPHENTGDQFEEDQFESYRALGDEIATETFQPIRHGGNLVTDASGLKELLSPAVRT